MKFLDVNYFNEDDDCYPYDNNGCEERNYYCSGSSCTYTYILDCRVPKLFRQEASPQLMVKLTDKKIKWAVEQVINKGESTELVVPRRYMVSQSGTITVSMGHLIGTGIL